MKTTGGYHMLRDGHASGARKVNRVGRSWLVKWEGPELPVGDEGACVVKRLGKKDVTIMVVWGEQL